MKWQRYLRYGAMGLITLMFLMAGITKLIGHESQVQIFEAAGYPLWFMYLIGVAELAAAIGLWIARTRVYAAALTGLIMLGAAATNVMIGAYANIIVNIVLLLAAAYIIWLERGGAIQHTQQTGGAAA
ncbi:MAG: DoxX family protein [Ardenticatenia bacterium]|nr:MAG: DoxX family protein [Ardenticatenia bacterium]